MLRGRHIHYILGMTVFWCSQVLLMRFDAAINYFLAITMYFSFLKILDDRSVDCLVYFLEL